jgi:hypothetical protein
LDADQAEMVARELDARPSVWEPTNETGLRDLAIAASGSQEAMLAQAILDLSAEIVRIRARMLQPDATACTVDVVELSGGGGRMLTRLPMKADDRLEILFEPDDDLPPIRALLRIVHAYEDPGHGYGFAFQSIHARDRDRLIRLIYQLQRRALREAHREEAPA